MKKTANWGLTPILFAVYSDTDGYRGSEAVAVRLVDGVVGVAASVQANTSDWPARAIRG